MKNDFVKKVIEDRVKDLENCISECDANIRVSECFSDGRTLKAHSEGLKQGYEIAKVLLNGIKELL